MEVDRRKFLDIFGRGETCLAIAPFPTLKEMIKSTIPKPFWFNVISKGVDYFPDVSMIDYKDWNKKTMKKKAYNLIIGSFSLHKDIIQGNIPNNDSNLDMLVASLKGGQYLLEHIEGKYVYAEGFPEVTYKEDPTRAIILSLTRARRITTKGFS